jgi:hypothetical protein
LARFDLSLCSTRWFINPAATQPRASLQSVRPSLDFSATQEIESRKATMLSLGRKLAHLAAPSDEASQRVIKV